MKSHLKRISFPLIALFGLALIFYPVLSNVLYDLRQDGVIDDYQTAVQSIPENDPALLRALSLARAYNERLASGTVNLNDPYANEDQVQYGDTISAMMDVTGTGIIGVVEIPRLALTLPVFYGTEDNELEQGAGTLEYTSIPIGGESTHSVLCAHSGLSSAKLFSDLPNMEIGDLFFLHVMGLDLAYQVDQIETVLPEDVSRITITTGEDYCTLLTCVPYGINTHRLLVRGTRTDYLPEQTAEITENTPAPRQSVWLREYILSILLGLAVFAVILLVWSVWNRFRRKKGTQ